MSVVAKFRCSFIDEPLYIKKAREERPDAEQQESRVIHMSAVADEDGTNANWSKWTPAGDLQMYVTNPDAFGQFEVGKCYLLTFEESA